MSFHTPSLAGESRFILASADGLELTPDGTWRTPDEPGEPALFTRTQAAVKLLELSALAPRQLFSVVEIDPSRAAGDPGRVRARIL